MVSLRGRTGARGADRPHALLRRRTREGELTTGSGRGPVGSEGGYGHCSGHAFDACPHPAPL